MIETISVENYIAPPIDYKAIYRYAQCPHPSQEVVEIVEECIKTLRLTYKVCFREFEVKKCDDKLDLSFCCTDSKSLMQRLDGCNNVVVFAATVGFDVDRMITKNSRLNPAKALIYQAIGTERVESLCDAFEVKIQEKYCKIGQELTPRFSPGYADLPLEMQKDIFRALDCFNKIGVSLNDSLLMTPSKSVTAIIGVRGTKK